MPAIRASLIDAHDEFVEERPFDWND